MHRQNVETQRDFMTRVLAAWGDGSLVLFLGAGISVPYGIPAWNDLVLRLLLGNETDARVITALRIAVAETLQYDPAALSRVLKNGRRAANEYRTSIRDALYATMHEPRASEDTLSVVASLIKRSRRDQATPRIRAVVTTNFDNLLEQHLVTENVPFEAIYNQHRPQREDAVPIYHIHGYLPCQPQLVPDDQYLVFTEDDYHALTYTPYHWTSTELLHLLRSSTFLFIGCSMSDPNLRRLLDATAPPPPTPTELPRPSHFAFRRAPSRESTVTCLEALLCRARNEEPSASTAEAARSALESAFHYDGQMLAHLGVGTIWVKEYADIGPHLSTLTAVLDPAPGAPAPRSPQRLTLRG